MAVGVELFERVCHVLWRAGFDVAHTGSAGLQVGLRARGILVGWRPEEEWEHRSGSAGRFDCCGQHEVQWDAARSAVTLALEAVLRQAGCIVVADGGDLLITG